MVSFVRSTLLLTCLIGTFSFHAIAQESTYTYEQARKDRVLTFPKDHGAHSNFKTEWWYFTGQLYEKDAKPFYDKPKLGYQLTFFRANTDGTQGYLAHAAVTDFTSGTHRFSAITAPGAYNFAGASQSHFKVWNRDWSVGSIARKLMARFSIPEAFDVRLLLLPKSSELLQGENGFSLKGECDTCASHYISFPLLETDAEVSTNDSAPTVLKGLSWMDHEFMSNSLSESQIGWDWFSIMLKDNRQLMLFRVRDSDTEKSFHSGTIVWTDALGTVQKKTLSKADFTISELDFWKSSETNAKYPSKWRISIPNQSVDITLQTRVKDQELTFQSEKVSAYYEGAIAADDESAIGYVEMTGYSSPLQKVL